MDIFPLAIEHTQLAARVTDLFTQSHHLAYAQVDPELSIQQTSSNFAAFLKLPPELIYGKPVTQLFPPLQTTVSRLEELLQGERSYFRLDYGEQSRNAHTPATTHYILHLHPLVEEVPQAGLLLILENHTLLQQTLIPDQAELLLAHQKLAEANAELHRVNQIKTLFMSMAAHDLRTPLTTIFGFADMLLEDLSLEDEIKREILGVIRAQSERLHRLIADLLDIERIDRGQIVLKPSDCNLNEIVHEVLASLQPLYETRELSLVVSLPEPPLFIYGDAARIWQIMYNLLNNAVKYTSERERVEIEVSCRGDSAVLRVSDSGRGLTPEQLTRLFDLHYRTAEAKASTVLGSGLGLYIVKTMAEAHNGEVKVDSVLGQGTTFTVRLPLSL